MEQDLVERIRQYMPNGNAVLAKNLARLFDEYTQNGVPANSDSYDLDQLLEGADIKYGEKKARLIEALKNSGYFSEKEMMLNDATHQKQEQDILHNDQCEKMDEAALAYQEETRTKYNKALEEIYKTGDSDVEEVICKLVPEMKKLQEILDLTLNSGKYINGCIILGPAGTRKTFFVQNELRKRKLQFALGTSHASALGIFELLFKNRTGIVVLDDLEMILEDRKALGILKAAVFGPAGVRLVTWHSTTRVLKERGLPDEFLFEGKILIIGNDLPSNKLESFKAFLGRFYVHHIKLNEDARKILIRSVFLKQDMFELTLEKKKELLEYIESLIDYAKLDQFNLRTVIKAAEVYKLKGDAGKDLIAEMFGTDERIRKLLLIEERAKHLPVNLRRNIWKEYTGYSGPTYHLLKAKYFADRYDNAARLDHELQELDDIIEAEAKKI